MVDKITTHQAEDDARNEDILIYVNGELKPKKEAVVSVYDSGFMLGDGVWEGVRLYNGVWAFLDDHLDRLIEALKAIDLDLGLSREGIKNALLETQVANNMTSDAHVRMMVTRGVKIRPFQHPSLSRSGPTFVIIIEHSRPRTPRPVRLATVPHLCGLPMTQDPKLNSHSKLNYILACIAAEKAGADEALMLDIHGFVNTTNACNFSLVDVYGADEAFLTGTFGAQTPVSELDVRIIGNGELGPVTTRIRSLYKGLINEVCA